MRIQLSPSRIALADTCWWQYWLRYVRGIKTAATPANLAFGSAVDLAIRNYLIAWAFGRPLPNLVDEFTSDFSKRRRTQTLVYAATQTPEIFEGMGVDLMRAFPGAWEESGCEIAMDVNDQPMVDVKLDYSLGKRRGLEVVVKNVIDLVVYTPDRSLAVLDVKSAAAEHTDVFTFLNDQLSSYQVAMDAHENVTGLGRVAKLGFLDLLKRKASSRIEPPKFMPRRTDDAVRAFRDKCFAIAENIRDQRFYKQPRMQFNTPCDMCDFKNYCAHGDTEDLIIPDQSRTAAA